MRDQLRGDPFDPFQWRFDDPERQQLATQYAGLHRVRRLAINELVEGIKLYIFHEPAAGQHIASLMQLLLRQGVETVGAAACGNDDDRMDVLVAVNKRLGDLETGLGHLFRELQICVREKRDHLAMIEMRDTEIQRQATHVEQLERRIGALQTEDISRGARIRQLEGLVQQLENRPGPVRRTLEFGRTLYRRASGVGVRRRPAAGTMPDLRT